MKVEAWLSRKYWEFKHTLHDVFTPHLTSIPCSRIQPLKFVHGFQRQLKFIYFLSAAGYICQSLHVPSSCSDWGSKLDWHFCTAIAYPGSVASSCWFDACSPFRQPKATLLLRHTFPHHRKNVSASNVDCFTNGSVENLIILDCNSDAFTISSDASTRLWSGVLYPQPPLAGKHSQPIDDPVLFG